MSVSISLSWTSIEWHLADTWKRVLLPALAAQGLVAEDLKRSVYVIRLTGVFVVKYPSGESPVVYVGEGSFGTRIQSHRKWARELQELIPDPTFEVCVAAPRVQRQPNTYRDCEAVILRRFGERFGCAPLWNKQFERRRFPHHEYSQRKVDWAIGKRSGAKYHWAIQPMKASSFYESYKKTHLQQAPAPASRFASAGEARR